VILESPIRAKTIMSITSAPTDRTVIHYPDTDGEPMAENTLQFKWIVTIKEGLEAVFRNDDAVFVAGDLFWYPVRERPDIRRAPDTMVAFGRPKGHRGSYKQWEEDGIAPQVVFEVLSPSNRALEATQKFSFYEQYGVEEYYVYDPDTGEMAGWLRAGTRLEEIESMKGFTSPHLGIRFEPGEGPDNLKIIGPDGRPFATYVELFEQREAERTRAEAEKQRAEAEKQRAEAERERAAAEQKRADKLAAKLRELGVEPE
jgi:Uma2 family endonuclease